MKKFYWIFNSSNPILHFIHKMCSLCSTSKPVMNSRLQGVRSEILAVGIITLTANDSDDGLTETMIEAIIGTQEFCFRHFNRELLVWLDHQGANKATASHSYVFVVLLMANNREIYLNFLADASC